MAMRSWLLLVVEVRRMAPPNEGGRMVAGSDARPPCDVRQTQRADVWAEARATWSPMGRIYCSGLAGAKRWALAHHSLAHTHPPEDGSPPPEGRGLHPGEASLKGGHSGSSARRNYRTFSGKRIYGRRQNSIASEMRSLSVFRCQSHPRQ